MSDRVRDGKPPPTYYVDLQSYKNGQYDVQVDDDDGTPRAGRSGVRSLSEAQLNGDLFAHLPIKAHNGRVFTAAGREVSATSASVLTDFSSPPLPELLQSRPPSPLRGGTDTLNWLTNSQEIEDAAFMWQALMTAAQSSIDDTRLARKLRNHFQKLKLQFKADEIDHSKSRIEHEKKSAWLNFSLGLTGLALGALAGAGGVAMKSWGWESSGGALGSVAFSVPFLCNGLGQALDKSVGPMKRVYEEQINEKYAQKLIETLEQSVEDARSNEQEARDLHNQTKDLIREHTNRQLDINKKITSIG